MEKRAILFFDRCESGRQQTGIYCEPGRTGISFGWNDYRTVSRTGLLGGCCGDADTCGRRHVALHGPGSAGGYGRNAGRGPIRADSAGTVRLDTLHFSALDVSAEWSGANEALFEGDKENTYLLLKSGEKLPYQTVSIDHADGTRIFMKFWDFNMGLGHISADDVQAVVFAGQEIPIA